MNRKRRCDLDGEGLPPFAVLRGEWWAERRTELASATRLQLSALLDEKGIRHGAADMYWLRMRAAYAGMLEFYAERGEEVPPRMLGRVRELDGRRPRAIRRGEVDIFRDVRAVEREEKANERYIEAAIAREAE